MKIQVVSDLHLEFSPITIENAGDTDVLVLSGDICVVKQIEKHIPFFEDCCRRFPRVVYIMGNHEHYNGDYNVSAGVIRDKLSHLLNLHFLDRQYVMINDVMFLGGTLWTDMNKEDPITLQQIQRMMNDYRVISDSGSMISYRTYPEGDDGPVVFKERSGIFSPETSVEDHKSMVAFIKTTLSVIDPSQKVVVVGHHAPTKASIKPRYRGDFIVNGAYSSDLSDIMLDNPCIKLWTHGHTHDTFDYMVGSTRVFCNPRGYHGYERTGWDPSIVLEV